MFKRGVWKWGDAMGKEQVAEAARKDAQVVKVWQVRYTLMQLEKFAEKTAKTAEAFPQSDYLRGASDALRRFIILMAKLVRDWDVQ